MQVLCLASGPGTSKVPISDLSNVNLQKAGGSVCAVRAWALESEVSINFRSSTRVAEHTESFLVSIDKSIPKLRT